MGFRIPCRITDIGLCDPNTHGHGRELAIVKLYVRAFREAQHLSQAALAARSRVSQAHLSEIERGKAVPSVVLARALAQGLGCRVDDLITGERQVTESSQPTRGRWNQALEEYWPHAVVRVEEYPELIPSWD